MKGQMKKTKGKKKVITYNTINNFVGFGYFFIGWINKPAKKMVIAVLDTTVPATDGQE